MKNLVLAIIFLTACTACDNNEEAFPDAAFKACIENRLKEYSNIYDTTYNIDNEKDLEVVGMLGCDDGGVSSLKGIEKLVNLADLGLNNNQIESVEPIRHLKKLQVLDLGINKTKDVEPLSGVTSLKTLILSDNYIAEIRNLRTLISLNELYIGGNCIIDTTQYAELTSAIPSINIYGEDKQTPEKCQ